MRAAFSCLFSPALCAMLVLVAGTAGAAEDLAARLRAVRSLRCTFTDDVTTWVRSGRRTVEQSAEKGIATYDNINLAKGTARIVTSGGAGGLAVWMEPTFGSLWMSERTPSGNTVITTVFPMYAEGTKDFVVLEARHSITGAIVLGEESYGTCTVLE
jgi:hypothetical protein